MNNTQRTKREKHGPLGALRLGTDHWFLSDKGILNISLETKQKVYSTKYVKSIYKIGRKYKDQPYSDYTLYPLELLVTPPSQEE